MDEIQVDYKNNNKNKIRKKSVIFKKEPIQCKLMLSQ